MNFSVAVTVFGDSFLIDFSMQGDTHPLNDGDVVSLLVQDYAFRILVEKSSSSSQKRKPEPEKKAAGSDEEDISPQKPQLKKQKSELPPSSSSSSSSSKPKLPVCMYGPGCYRKNPQHFAEFSHPWKDKGAAEEETAKAAPPPSSSSSSSSKKQSRNSDDDDEIMESAPKKPAAQQSTSKPPVSTPSFSYSAKPAVRVRREGMKRQRERKINQGDERKSRGRKSRRGRKYLRSLTSRFFFFF
jgi:hypothetical protein